METTEKNKFTLGIAFWFFLIIGGLISGVMQLLGTVLVWIAFALGIIWLIRRFKKPKQE